ncbi:ASCH domain-containing protein [Rhodocytophaga rosea]|uniref:ASCH domain-containing protein n=1 Tax=Rhodocytophaga rosea TaxID=2704465 RepID=A0A6C0GBV2_9BACT|nr:ASCH domain-containing protein [Rhodocytophaga rosea]QHT65324.1 ASCH domain-containing protein [Rhodocytophaga rosea]
MIIHALSVRQPYAEMIISGIKSVELRTWTTPFRGRLWLHTGLKSDASAEAFFRQQLLIGNRILDKGCYLGILNLTAIVPMDKQRWELWRKKHHDLSDYTPNFYGWLFSVDKRFETPIHGRGAQGLFTPSELVLTQLRLASNY